MDRTLPVLVSCIGLAALSCDPIPHASNSLPSVSAPPPGAEVAQDVSRSTGAPNDDASVREIAGHLRSYHTRLARREIDELARTIVDEARRSSIDATLVLAVIHVESAYYNFAVSPVGALGLMQVLPATGEEIARELGLAWSGPQTLFDPITNVRVGVAYLRQLSDRYGSLPVALAAYNWGPARVDRRLRRGTPVPTRFAQLVLDTYGERTTEVDRPS